MSIESSFERMALALERLAGLKATASVAQDIGPAGGAPINTGTSVLTPEALKKAAIEIASKLTPDEAKNFTAYVRGYVCSRFGVQKLMNVPADQVEYAMGELKAFDKTQDYSPKKGN